MSAITTHVLDISRGKPGAGLRVTLHIQDDKGVWKELARATTERDGRVKTLLDPNTPLAKATYRLTFETGPYFAATRTETLYPRVEVVFAVADPKLHHHIPLLLSPFGYSTYRGS